MKRFIFAFLLGIALPLPATPEIVSHRPDDHRIVRTLDQEIAALFTFPRHVAPTRKLRITFDRDAPKKIARLETARAIEYVIRDGGTWVHDDEVMTRLAGALLAHRAGYEKEVRVPRFLLAAMRAELRGIANFQRINRSNYWFIFLRALRAADRPVDYSVLAPHGGFAPVEIYQEEAGHILLYAARRRDLTGGILRDILAGAPATEKLLLALDEAARKEELADADELLRRTADWRIWHGFAPRPAAVSRRDFARITRREIEELNPFGKPTGRRVPVEIEIWCDLIGTRSDAEAMRKILRSDLHDFARGETPAARAVIARLSALDFRPGDGEKIAALKQELEAVWHKREIIERFLARSEVCFGGVGAHAPARLDAIRHRTELLSPRGKSFLDRVEKLYLGESL